MDLEEVWRIREEEIYPSLFGCEGRGIFVLTSDLFTERFRQKDYDPRWLHHGVFEFPPTGDRTHWLYVTSGYSNPWDQEPGAYDTKGESGTGVEFTFAVSEGGEWAIRILQSMLAYDMLLAAGCFPNKGPLAAGDRIPWREPLDGRDQCLIRNLVMVKREGGPQEFILPSGRVALAGFTGITDAELAFAKEHGSAALIKKLRKAGAHPVTNTHRASVV